MNDWKLAEKGMKQLLRLIQLVKVNENLGWEISLEGSGDMTYPVLRLFLPEGEARVLYFWSEGVDGLWLEYFPGMVDDRAYAEPHSESVFGKEVMEFLKRELKRR